MLRASALLALFVLHAGYVYAQQGCDIRLMGIVQETHTNEPLFPVVVHIDELNKEYETDENGKFVIDGLCAGKYNIHFHTAGYEHFQQEISIVSTAQMRFRLSHVTHDLSEVEVKAEKDPSILQSKQQMSKMEIAAASGKTISQMLESVNGVSMLSNGGTIAKPVIHGMHSNRIVMLNNGIRQEDQQWGGEHAPNIDPFLANKITVIKGAAGVRYGTDAIAGVVLVEPAPLPVKPGWAGELNLAGFSNNRMGVSSAMVEHNLKELPALSFRVQGTYKKSGNYRVPGYWAANTGVEENNFSAALGWRRLHYGAEVFYSRFNTDLGIYTGSHTGNEKDLLAAINSKAPLVPSVFSYDIGRPMQQVQHDMLKTRLYADTRAGMFTLVHGYQHNFRQEYDIVRKDDGKAQLNLTLNTHTLNLDLQHKPVGLFKGSIGIDGMAQQNTFQTGDRLFIPGYNALGGAAYLIERVKLDEWQLEAGLRYDYKWYDVFNREGSNQQLVEYKYQFSNISGTVGASRQLTDNWDLNITLANAWRPPQANELFSAGLHHGAARIELGNKNLLPERSYNLNVETKYSWQKLLAEVSLYGQYVNDYIYLEPGANMLTIRGFFKTFNYKQTDAFLPGTDISLKYQWNKHLATSAKGSFLRARDVAKSDWLILMPSDRISANVKYTRSINSWLQDCYIGLDARYVFRQTRIPANFDSLDNRRPPADYFLLGAETGTKLVFHRQPVYISLSVSNLLNASYRDYLDAFRYFIDQPGTNFALCLRVPFDFLNNSKN